MGFDLRESFEGGAGFRKIFINVITVSISLFLALTWQSFIAEAVAFYFPAGQGLGQKFGINIAITVVMVYAAYALLKFEKKFNRK